MKARTIFVLGIVAMACDKPAPTVADAAPPIASASAVPKAATPATTTPTPDDELVTLTQRWNDALAKRDASALEKIYGADVRLYDQNLSRAAAVKNKAAALAKSPDYTQSIASIAIDRKQADRPTATFLKTWKTGGKESSVAGILVFGKEPSGWVVVEESDQTTDKKRLARFQQGGCLHLVHAVVASTESGRAYAPPRAGTIVVCEPPSCDTFQIAGGRFGGDPPSFQREATFDVDAKKGVVLRAGAAEAADPALLAKMKTACAEP
jgi:hypothetical protein